MVARSVGIKLNRQVLANGRRGHIVLYSDGSRTSAHVAVDIGYRQGHRVGADVCAIEAAVVQRHRSDATVV